MFSSRSPMRFPKMSNKGSGKIKPVGFGVRRDQDLLHAEDVIPMRPAVTTQEDVMRRMTENSIRKNMKDIDRRGGDMKLEEKHFETRLRKTRDPKAMTVISAEDKPKNVRYKLKQSRPSKMKKSFTVDTSSVDHHDDGRNTLPSLEYESNAEMFRLKTRPEAEEIQVEINNKPTPEMTQDEGEERLRAQMFAVSQENADQAEIMSIQNLNMSNHVDRMSIQQMAMRFHKEAGRSMTSHDVVLRRETPQKQSLDVKPKITPDEEVITNTQRRKQRKVSRKKKTTKVLRVDPDEYDVQNMVRSDPAVMRFRANSRREYKEVSQDELVAPVKTRRKKSRKKTRDPRIQVEREEERIDKHHGRHKRHTRPKSRSKQPKPVMREIQFVPIHDLEPDGTLKKSVKRNQKSRKPKNKSKRVVENNDKIETPAKPQPLDNKEVNSRPSIEVEVPSTFDLEVEAPKKKSTTKSAEPPHSKSMKIPNDIVEDIEMKNVKNVLFF